MSRVRHLAEAAAERLGQAERVARARLGQRRPRLVVALVAVAALVTGVLVAALGGDDREPQPGGEDPAQAAERSAAPPDQVAALLRDMPVERKVAQLILVGFEGTGTDDPTIAAFVDRDYAGLVFDAHNYRSADQVSSLGEEVVSAAEDADHVTPWLMAPQEGGDFNAFADLPPDEAPSELPNPREARKAAREAAEALADLGFSGILAPLIDVAPFGGGAIGERAYSDEAERVVDYARATVEAYDDAGIVSAAKYFPGLGAASQPTENGPATVGLTLGQLLDRDLLPFQEAIEAGVPAIVVGHGRYVTDDFVRTASTSAAVVTGLLRDDLGFEGVAIADDVTSPAVTATTSPDDAAIEAVVAGADLVYVSQDADTQSAVYRALLTAVEDGTITAERLDEALRRNLEAKLAAGLVEARGGGAGGGAGGGGAGGGPGGGGADRGGRSEGPAGSEAVAGAPEDDGKGAESGSTEESSAEAGAVDGKGGAEGETGADEAVPDGKGGDATGGDAAGTDALVGAKGEAGD